MKKHICDKEAEIAEMHTDIKWIRKTLEGNGKPGIVGNVEMNTEFRQKSQAKEAFVKFLVGSGWLTTLIMYFLK